MARMNLWRYFFLVALSMCLFSCKENETPFDPQAQLVNDINAIDQYLTSVGIEAYKDNSGIRFVINQLGTGLPPTRLQSAKIVYSAELFDGMTVEETRMFENNLAALPTQGLIRGCEILPMGTKATLYVPSGLAYGNNRIGSIPPNTNLVYDVEVQEVIRSSMEAAQLGLDSIAIDAYLSSNSIASEKGPLGIRYVVHEQGTGVSPTWYDQVRINYTGKLLSTAAQFYSGTVQPSNSFDSRVVNYLPGLQVAMQLLPEGSRATFYIPSSLGFGVIGAGEGAVPPNANLIYEINSLEIVND